MEKKKSGFPECLAAALGGEGFYKNQRNFFPECLGQALGEEGFLKKMKCLPRVLHSEKRVLKKFKFLPRVLHSGKSFFQKQMADGTDVVKSSPSAPDLALGEGLFLVSGFADRPSPNVALGEGFPECFGVFPECI
jgi:hypothetical protein